MGLTSITVSGGVHKDASAGTATGTVQFTPNTAFRNLGDNVIVTRETKSMVLAGGSLAGTLYACDDIDTDTEGVCYEVRYLLDDEPDRVEYHALSNQVTTLNWSDAVPLNQPPVPKVKDFTTVYFNKYAGRLPEPWIDGHDLFPDSFAPVGVLRSMATVLDGTKGDPTALAIGCAYRPFGEWAADGVMVTTTWNGIDPIEGTPLLHINPSTRRFGAGMWTVHFAEGTNLVLGAYIGRPASAFADYLEDTGSVAHTNGNDRVLKVGSYGGHIYGYIDDVLKVDFDLAPELCGSTMHGFALDSHWCTPGWDPAAYLDPLPDAETGSLKTSWSIAPWTGP